jgi:type IV pilus assembly protein PilC
MPHFICRLAAEDGRVFSQPFFASSFQECRKRFEEQGFCVLSVKRDWKRIQIPVFFIEKKIREKDFIPVNQELVALIKAGYPIVKSLGIIIGRVKNPRIKEMLMSVESKVRGGKALSEAFADYERELSTVYIASLMAGERSGNLAETINRYIDYARRISRTKSKIRTALTYPTLLLGFSFLLIALLINFVFPRFADFYADFEAQLPGISRALMSFSLAVRDSLPFLLAVVGLAVLVSFALRKREKTALWLNKMKLHIPYGRVVWLESAVSLFCRTLSLLLGGGITLLSSVGVASKAVPNRFLFHRMKVIPDSIRNGESLSEALKKTDFFPPLALDMIRIGETSANLEGMLGDVADVYDERVQSRIDRLVSLIEPIVIIFMGLIVAVMLFSVYFPIFNIIRITR